MMLLRGSNMNLTHSTLSHKEIRGYSQGSMFRSPTLQVSSFHPSSGLLRTARGWKNGAKTCKTSSLPHLSKDLKHCHSGLPPMLNSLPQFGPLPLPALSPPNDIQMMKSYHLIGKRSSVWIPKTQNINPLEKRIKKKNNKNTIPFLLSLSYCSKINILRKNFYMNMIDWSSICIFLLFCP